MRGTASARCRTCSERCVDVVVHAIQNAQDGVTALELAPDEGTVKCFLDYGIKLADIVTDQVVIACVSVSDGPASYVSVWGGGDRDRDRMSKWFARVCVRTRASEETDMFAAVRCIRAITGETGVMLQDRH